MRANQSVNNSFKIRREEWLRDDDGEDSLPLHSQCSVLSASDSHVASAPCVKQSVVDVQGDIVRQ